MLPPPFNMIVLIVVVVFVVGLLESIAKQIRIYTDNQADRRFKLDLVERGIDPEEAERWAQIETKKKKKK